MTPPLWIALGFTALLVVFLMAAYFGRGGSAHQWAILRFLSSLCAGFAGGFFTGSAVISMTQRWGTGELTASGVAGMGLFIAVFFGFAKFAQRPPDAFNFSVPEGWNFQAAARAMVERFQYLPEFLDFSEAELNASLNPNTVRVTSLVHGLQALRRLTRNGHFPEYQVSINLPVIQIRRTS